MLQMACVSVEGISAAAFDAELFGLAGRVILDLKPVPSRFATNRDCVCNCVTVAHLKCYVCFICI